MQLSRKPRRRSDSSGATSPKATLSTQAFQTRSWLAFFNTDLQVSPKARMSLRQVASSDRSLTSAGRSPSSTSLPMAICDQASASLAWGDCFR